MNITQWRLNHIHYTRDQVVEFIRSTLSILKCDIFIIAHEQYWPTICSVTNKSHYRDTIVYCEGCRGVYIPYDIGEKITIVGLCGLLTELITKSKHE